MNNLTLPILLTLTIVIAGVFAFAPIDQASTVHTEVMANTLKVSEIALASGGAGEDLEILCPATSDACRILEVYFEEDNGGAGQISLNGLDALIGATTFVISADLNTSLDDAAAAIGGISGVTIGGGDTLTIDITGTSASYNVIVYLETEGNTTPTADFD